MKVIKINTPDGQYTLPLIKVAEHRAAYYEKDKESSGFIAEVEWVLNDNYEAIDWLLNNTDYSDWEDETTKINSYVKVTMDDFWTNCEGFEIVDV